MRKSLLGGLTVAFAASGSASASVWSISGASIAGGAQSISSIRSGVIDISGGIQAALDGEFDSLVTTPVVSPNTLAFFSFEDLGGVEYFGFYWLSDLSIKQLTFTASATGGSGLQTDTPFGSSPSSSVMSSSGNGDSYYYLYSGVGPGSTIAMSGLVSNVEIQWLDWDGSAWQLLGPGTTTGTAPGDESFSLATATTVSAVPGGTVAGLAGVGLAGRLLGRRRTRRMIGTRSEGGHEP
jgi:hypothetical protein